VDGGVGIFRVFENMRYMKDICDMLYEGGTCYILFIYSLSRTKYNKISKNIKY